MRHYEATGEALLLPHVLLHHVFNVMPLLACTRGPYMMVCSVALQCRLVASHVQACPNSVPATYLISGRQEVPPGCQAGDHHAAWCRRVQVQGAPSVKSTFDLMAWQLART